MRFNVNNGANILLTKQLKQMHRSNFPIAVRETLNSAAFDMKRSTLPSVVKRKFTQRRKTFFRARSKVFKAKGFDLNSMQSTVGFVGNDQAVDNLEQQEFGGKIGSRDFLTTNIARIGGSYESSVKTKNRINQARRYVDARKLPGNKKQQFGRALQKVDKGGFVLADFKNTTFLWKFNKFRKGGNGVQRYDLDLIYTFEQNRSVSVKETKFMREAGKMSGEKLDFYYRKQAQRRFKFGRK